MNLLNMRCILCLAGLMKSFMASAQLAPAGDAATNQAPARPSDLSTNQVYSGALTNAVGSPPVPPEFGLQTGGITPAAPTTPGSGQLGSPLFGSGVLGSAPGFGAGLKAPTTPGLFRLGPFDFHPMLNYSVEDASGIESRPGSQGSTIINTVSPGVWITAGPHWDLHYTESSALYSGATTLSDTFSHFVTLNGAVSNSAWGFGLIQDYSTSTSVLAETGTNTEQDIYLTSLSASHQLGGKLSVEVQVSQTFRSASPFDDVDMWSGTGVINYRVTPRLQVGLSLSGGYDRINPGTDLTFEELQGTLHFVAGERLMLELSGGAEDQQFVSSTTPSTLTPIFSASLQYLLFKPTILLANAGRSISPSYIGGLETTSTRLTAGVQQQLSQRFHLSVIGAYSTSSFETTEPLTAAELAKYFYFGIPSGIKPLTQVRNDTYESVTISLNYVMSQRLTASAFYNIGQNASSQSDYAFTSSQFGLQLNYRY